MANSTHAPDPARELAAQYGDDIGAMPEGPAKELAKREYWLTVAEEYRDFDRAAQLKLEIADLRRDHPQLAD